ncbi:RnfABCDGE type electron transport complex subunit B [Piscirickettsia salmonis]|uniref:RnfABCDGE type electron transport complex subunit B n=1 Tax=Piscirickettsia salmonis TaxID=1238 RepID=UPI000F0933C7|nr:electron transport complex subunit B [Piscirickettsiaceae bacterium NZ-RLO2]
MKTVPVTAIEAVLPQTQCTRCGYPDCHSYATAIAAGTPHNQCPPGGPETIVKLSELLGRKMTALNPDNGQHGPKLLAQIDESRCIGCVKCIKACPVDAISGGPKRMHTVIQSECNGCELCVAPCPMDCIDMVPAPIQYNQLEPDQYQQRYHARTKRLIRERENKLGAQRHARQGGLKQVQSDQDTVQARQDFVKAAAARAKAKRLAKLNNNAQEQ